MLNQVQHDVASSHRHPDPARSVQEGLFQGLKFWGFQERQMLNQVQHDVARLIFVPLLVMSSGKVILSFHFEKFNLFFLKLNVTIGFAHS